MKSIKWDLAFLVVAAVYFLCASAQQINNTDPSSSGVQMDVSVAPKRISNSNSTGESIENRRSLLLFPSSDVSPQSSSSSRGDEVTLAFAMHEIGVLECTGVDHLTGGHFFERLMGPGADASGNYLCQPTCGGTCVPNQDIGVAPRSLYPFGCKCNPNRCNAEGPIVTHFGSGRFKIICARDHRCTCDGMSSPDVPHMGYICNWINLNTLRIVTFMNRPINRPHLHPTYSPIRWCSCCPQTRLF